MPEPQAVSIPGVGEPNAKPNWLLIAAIGGAAIGLLILLTRKSGGAAPAYSTGVPLNVAVAMGDLQAQLLNAKGDLSKDIQGVNSTIGSNQTTNQGLFDNLKKLQADILYNVWYQQNLHDPASNDRSRIWAPPYPDVWPNWTTAQAQAYNWSPTEFGSMVGNNIQPVGQTIPNSGRVDYSSGYWDNLLHLGSDTFGNAGDAGNGLSNPYLGY